MKNGTRHVLKFFVAVLIILNSCRTAWAQQSADMAKLQQDLSALKDELKALSDKQQQILDDLAEMQKVLQGGASSLPALQLPTTDDVQADPVQGASTANAAIIEYTDFQCPFCQMFMLQTFPKILKNYINTGKVKFFYRDWPSAVHPFAMSAARAARCAGEQGKFWQMYDSLFGNQDELAYDDLVKRGSRLHLDQGEYNRCLSSNKYGDVIERNTKVAKVMGVMGTPTFLLGTIASDGHTVKIEKAIEGAQPYSAFKSTLDSLLASKQQSSAAASAPTKQHP
jgi:protein-disulfide isomerase